jgi:cytochrome c-type biogenesis protein CcmE
MKLTHIFGLLVLAVMAGIVITSTGNASQYVGYTEARALATSGDKGKVHVIGELTKNNRGEVVGVEYNPLQDPNYLAFQLIDEKGTRFKVVTYSPPPSMQDFTHSEKVVVIGRAGQSHFQASEILLKCPSKYEDEAKQASL